jgi:hypothetical protein
MCVFDWSMNAKDLAYAASRGGTPPTGVSDAVKALWLARAGRWEEAHQMCQNVENEKGAWVHAHLHRVKGEFDNAEHWYAIAGRSQPEGQSLLGEEWFEMAKELLASEPS